MTRAAFPGRTLLRYLAREISLPSAAALAIFTFIVVSQDLIGWTDLVMHRGLGAGTVGWIALFETVPQVARTLPFAVLVGSLAALGRLAADNELLALEASGLSALELLQAVAIWGSLATLPALLLSLFGAPAASRALDRTLADVAQREPAAGIQANFVNRFGDWRLEAREVSERGHRMRGVLLWIPGVGETIFAERGAIEATPERWTRLTLENGMVLRDPRRSGQRIDFESLSTLLPETGFVPREDSQQIAGRRLAELVAVANAEDAPAGQPLLARIELQRRFALASATLLFGALALPLLLFRRSFSRSGGATLGILATIGYYALVQLGNGLVEGGQLGVAAGVWLPDLAVCALASALLWRALRAPSYGHPARRTRRFGAGGLLRRAPATTGPVAHRFILDRYVARRFLGLAALAFVGLLVAYLLVDLLERLQFFARYGAGPREVGLYYAARTLLLASRIVPMSLLLAAALAVGLFGSENELLGMQVSGVPALRAMLPVLVICAGVAPFAFVLNERIVPGATQRWHYVKNVVIKGHSEPVRGEIVWYRIGDHVYEAEELSPELGSVHHVAIYRLGPNGLPVARTDARSARYLGRGLWSLADPVSVEVDEAGLRYVPAERFAELGGRLPEEIETTELSGGELGAEIGELEQAGYDATPLRVDYYAKLSTPLACIVLPALAVFFAVSGAPSPSPALTLVFGMVVAVGYVLASGAGASLGHAGVLPPLLAGAGPTLLLAALALYLGLRRPAEGR